MVPKNPPLEEIRHSLAHLLAMAVLKESPKVKLGIGPSIENGFYYDFDLPEKISDTLLPQLENHMRDFIKQGIRFEQKKINTEAAKKFFKERNQTYKLELIDEFVDSKQAISLVTSGDFTDLCRGGHVESTRDIDSKSFKLDRIAGTYWKGSEENPQLTRIYGLAFQTKKELENYVAQREEAKNRDHRKLGQDLDLFTFSELVGPGLPLWTPRGTAVRDILDDFVWQLRKKRGYEKVDIPHLSKKELYETSGHWEKFRDELFKITTREGHHFAVKPMNCPHHTQIYARKLFSYRELPQRYASTTKVYRDEQTGELAGLLRVRAITQDDAHVFCRQRQVREEILSIWDIVTEFYRAVRFDLKVRLSLRDPKKPQQYLGSPEVWGKAEDELRSITKEKGSEVEEIVGEAAFYGPKIDFIAKDSLGREWQVATIQLDMNLPERFDLVCVNEKGQRERIVMIHAAIMGSIERYLSILIEHFAGAFPLWLAPVQVAVIPVSDNFIGYARKVSSELREDGFRLQLDERTETVGRKIRDAELQKIPYMIVVGEEEKKAKKIRVRSRGEKKDIGLMNIENFIKRLSKEIEKRR